MAFFAALFAPLFATVKGMLGVLGFTSLGIKAGSLAAMIQSLIGNVVAKSLFAILQSAGMGGYGAAIVNGWITCVATVSAVFGAFRGYFF